MKKSIHVIFICIFSAFFYTGCSTLQKNNIPESKQTVSEIDDIIKHDKLTDKQKVILQHAKTELQSAQQTASKNEELQNELIKESKLAGAGKMVYTVIYFVAFLIVAFIGFKILKKFGIF